MKMLTVHRFFAALLASALILVGMQSCDMQGKIISFATAAVDQGDYENALKSILTLEDEAISVSDTLSQLLSIAYYGISLPAVRKIAVDCYDMDFTPDGKTIIFTDFGDGSLKFFSYPEMKFRRSLNLNERAFNIDLGPDGTVFAAAMADRTIRLYNLESGELIREFHGHSGRVRDIAFVDSSNIISCSNDRSVAAWNTTTGQPLWKSPLHEKNIKSLQLSNDRTLLITSSNDGSATIVRTSGSDAGAEELRLIHGPDYVNDAAISPGNDFAVTVSGDGSVKVWDAHSGLLRFEKHLRDGLGAVDISPDGKHIIIGGLFAVYIIDSTEGSVITKIQAKGKSVWSVKFTDATHFAFADDTHFWHGEWLHGPGLLSAARSLASTLFVAH